MMEHFSRLKSTTYKLYECPACGLQFWEPRKLDPRDYEELFDGYIGFHEGLAKGIGPNMEAFFERCPVRSGRLLDVGCGGGNFLLEAQRRGHEVWGIDLDSKSVKACRDKGLSRVFCATPEDFSQMIRDEGILFDVITFFEVLEHQENPRGFLLSLLPLLKRGGYLAGSVPNRDRFLAKLERRVVGGDCPPHHFLWFSPESLRNMLSLVGLSEVFVSEVYFGLRGYAWIPERIFLFGLPVKVANLIKRLLLKGTRFSSAASAWSLEHVSLEQVGSATKDDFTLGFFVAKVLGKLRLALEWPFLLPIHLCALLFRGGQMLYFHGMKD